MDPPTYPFEETSFMNGPLCKILAKLNYDPPYSMLTFEWFHLCQKIMKTIFTKCITSFYIVLQAKYWVFPLWFLHEYFSSNRKMPNLLCKILAKRSRLWIGRKCLSLGMWNEKGNLWVRALFSNFSCMFLNPNIFFQFEF